MKKLLHHSITPLLLCLSTLSGFADTPIKHLTVDGASQIRSGTFAVKTGVTFTGEAGSTFNFAASNLIFDDAQIPWAKVSKTSSSLADLVTRSATDLTSGTVPDARFPATLPAASGVNLTALNATNLASGTVPDARFPATLPAASGVNLTALNATNLASGTLPDARFPATLPAASGVNLTALNATNLASGTVPAARLPATFVNVKAQSSSAANASLVLNGTALDSSVDNTNGIMLALSHNGTGNRQIIFGDSAGLGDSSKTSFRFIVGITNVANIDGINNDGSVAKHINLAGPSTNIGIGFDPGSVTQTDITNKLHVVGQTRSTTGFKIGSCTWTEGSGSPEGVVTANVGSFHSRTDGGAGTSWYVKQSGTGNTGWVGK
ncbi:MAG TPA: hypothetical protein VNP98_17430 [Chthoniobacterales bacterium]|nr:hypothetical protein [Chthoniobacterales bacterium]